ncbi:biopolymer transporter ExbD [bacterium]|nr:biopolymer transporter ExbD [bacterium]
MKIRRRFFGAHLEAREARIDMIPMIDTIFLILTVLIYSMLTMTVHRGIKVELPQALTSIKEKKDLLTFTVTSAGEIYMNRVRVDKNDLLRRITAYRSAEPNTEEVYVDADRAADYGIVIEVLDACRTAGLVRISLETTVKR